MPEETGYLFFVELEGHQGDLRVKKAITSLQRRTLRLDILGSYPRSESPVEPATARP